MANTAKKTAKTATKTATKKTSKTATKTANKTIKVKKAKAKPEFVTETPVQKAVVLNETKASHKAKKETPSFEKIIAPLLAGIEENQVLIHDNAKLGATYWKGIGDYLIELQKAWVANGGDISWRGKNRTKNPISSEHPESFPEFRERVTSLNGPLFSTVIDNTEKLSENAKTGLSYWKAIGDNLIEIRKNWIAAGGDIKARGEASFATYRETSLSVSCQSKMFPTLS